MKHSRNKSAEHKAATSIADALNIGSKLCSMKLIQLVRRNEVLYNSDAEGYSDKNHKDIVWERIYKQLFPKYDTLSEELKERIRVNVRRRWKTLRNAIAREVKKNATIENYCRKKESPIIAELEFLIPHIKSAHCAKLADELGLRENYSFMHDTEEQDDDDYNDLIDLTSEIDVKPLIKMPNCAHSIEENSNLDGSGSGDDSMPHEVLYPAIQMSTSDISKNDTTSNASGPNLWNVDSCTVVQYKDGEFANPNILSSNQESETENNEEPAKDATQQDCKRRRVEVDEKGTEFHTRVMEFLSHYETQDEDRMFLLSLVSDLKRVIPARKMLVKAEIVTAIARGIQP